MTSRKPAAINISAELTSKILRTVSMAEAFHFFTDIGQDTGKSATSLADFSEKLKVVPLKSIEFHFKRGDFGRWSRETLGDEHLAREIGRIEESVHREQALESLRTAIQRTVENRLRYLKQRNSERAHAS
jgi:hypothetical protein